METIKSSVFWDATDLRSVKVRFNSDDIIEKIYKFEEVRGHRPKFIILEFPAGDLIHGIPVKWRTKWKR